MGTTEGPRQFMVRNHGGSSGKQSKRMSGKVKEIVLETDMTAKRNQGSTEEITIQVNKTAKLIEESEEDIYEDLPDLLTDSPATDTGYDEGMRNSLAELMEESEEDIYEDLPDLVTDSPDTGYDEARHSSNMRITDMITDMNNTELENFMEAASELASSDSPIEELKPLSQSFQEGYVCKTKTPKGSMYVGDTVIYSEDPTGTSLTYLEDNSGRHSKASQEPSEPMIIYRQ